MSASESVRNWLSRKGKNTAVPLNRPLLLNPSLELLEDRAVPTAYLVDSTLDNVVNDGLITLREAVLAANTGQPVGDAPAGDGNDQISFAAALAGQSISFQITGDSSLGNSALAVARNLSIEGLPQGELVSVTLRNDSTYGDRRLFLVEPGANLQLKDVILSDGVAIGASGNSGIQGGGGGGGGAGMGGAILNQGTLTVQNSTLHKNVAWGGRGGDGNSAPSSSAKGGLGGGLSGGAGGIANVAGQAGGFASGGGGGGGIGATASGAGGFSGENGFGGGAGGGSATNSTTLGDFAGRNVIYGGRGGQGNLFQGGGGGGGAGLGGAIYNLGGSVSVVNSTFGFNEAKGGPAGAGGTLAATGLGLGGAIFSQNGFVRVDNSTLAKNTASQGGAIFAVADGATASVTLNSTIAAQSDGVSDVVGRAIHTGILTVTGKANLIQYADNFAAGTSSSLDPQLTNLAQNGGPTPSFALRSGSPALQLGANDLGLVFDQRGQGFPRSIGSSIDIGAFEYGNNQVPQVLSINRYFPGDQATNATTVEFRVVFSQSLTGVTATDFALVGSGISGATIQSVSGSEPGLEFIVTVKTGGDGSLGLNLAQPGTATNALGDKVQGLFAGDFYNIDKTQPAVVGINLLDTNPTNANSVRFAVIFSKDLANPPALANFSLDGSGVSGDISSVVAVNGSASAFVVTVTNVSGSGNLKLNLSDPAGITDSVGNTLQSSYFSGQNYIVDQVAPEVTSITLWQDRQVTEGALEFQVVFSKPINRLTVNALTVQASSTGAPAPGFALGTISGSESTYRVRINGVGGAGLITISIADNAAIFDLYGNQLGLGLVSDPVAVSTTKPWVQSIVPLVTTPTNQPVVFQVTFSRDMQPASVTVDDFTLVGDGTAIGQITSVTPTANPAVYEVLTGGLVGTGRLGLDISPAAILQDQASGQRLSGTFTDTQFALVDTNGPLVNNILPMDANPTQETTLHFLVSFDKEVDPATVLNSSFTVVGPVGSLWTVSGASQDPIFSNQWIITVQSTGASANGSLVLSVPISGGIRDLAGNLLERDYGSGQSYSITSVAPGVSSIILADPNPTRASLLGYYISFSEDINPQTLNPSDFVVQTVSGTASGVVSSITGSGNQYLVLVTVTDGDGQLRLDTANDTDIRNLAGVKINAAGYTGGQVYDILFQPPTVVSATPKALRSGLTTVSFVVDFSAAMNPATLTPGNFQVVASGLSGTAFVASVVADPIFRNLCKVNVSGYSGSGSLSLNVLGNRGAQDMAGNPLIQGFTGGTSVEINTVAVVATAITPNRSATRLNPLLVPPSTAVTFEVLFSGNIDPITLSKNSFTLTGTSGVITSVNISPFTLNSAVVVVSNITTQGPISLNLKPNSGAADTYGNLISPAGVTGSPIVVSNAQPSVGSIVLVGNPTIVSSTAQYRISFITQNGINMDPASVTPAAIDRITTGSVQGVITKVAVDSVDPNAFLVNVSNITGSGTLSILIPSASQIQDLAGNTLASIPIASIPTIVNAIGPVVTSIQCVSAPSTNSTSVVFRVKYSESVKNAQTVSNYGPVITGAMSATITGVIPTLGNLDQTSFDVTISSISGKGSLGLKVLGSLITNVDGTPFNGPFVAGQSYVIDNQLPSVASSIPSISGPTSATSVTYTLVFNEPVKIATVTAGVLSLIKTGSVSGNLVSITALNEIANAFATTYQVEVDSIVGVGTLGLGVVANSNIEDAFGNLMTAAYTPSSITVINQSTPKVTSIVSGSTSPITTSTAIFRVLFDTPINPATVDAADFALDLQGSVTGFISSIVPDDLTNQTMRVTVEGLQGQGYTRINLVANATIQDFAGNLVDPAEVNGPADQVLNVAPRVVYIRAENAKVNGTTATFLVLIDQRIQGPAGAGFEFPVDISNFNLQMSGSVSGQIISATALQYYYGFTQITVVVGNLAEQGTLNLGVSGNSTLFNTVGIPLSQDFDPSASQTIEVNTVATVAQSIDLGGDAILDPTRSAGKASFVVNFSQPVDSATVSLSAFEPQLSGTTTGTLDSVQGSGSTYLVMMKNLTGTGSLQLNLRANSGIVDTFGTPVTAPFISGQTYTVQAIVPIQTPEPLVILNAVNATLPTSLTAIQFVAQFNRDMVASTVTAEKFNLVMSGGATGRITSVVGSGQTYLISVDSVSGTGSLSLRTIEDPLFQDYYGNKIIGQPTSLTGFEIDNTDPTVAGIILQSPTQTNRELLEFTVEFSEPVDPLSVNSVTIALSTYNGGQIVSVAQLTSTNYQITVASSLVSASVGLQFNGVKDLAGRSFNYNTTENQSYQLDRVGPNVVQINRLDSSPTGSPSVRYQIVFSETVDASTVTPSAFSTVVSGTLAASVRSVQGSGDTYILTVDVLGGSGNLNISVPQNSGIIDLVGNTMTGPFSASESYTINRNAPKVVSFVPVTPAVAAGQPINFLLTFDSPVNSATVVTSAFLVQASEAAGGQVTGIVGSGKQYQVTVVPTGGNGAIFVELPAFSGVLDAQGNEVLSAFVSTACFYEAVAPTVTSLIPLGSSIQGGPVLQFQVTFSQPMLTGSFTSDSVNFQTSGNAVVGFGNIQWITSTEAILNVNVVNGQGSLALEILSNRGILDLAGNALSLGATSTELLLEVTPPSVVLLYPDMSKPYRTNAGQVSFAVMFSEGMPAGAVPISAIQVITTGTLVAQVIRVDQDSQDQSVFHIIVGGPLPGLSMSGAGTLNLQIPDGAAIFDEAGNPLFQGASSIDGIYVNRVIPAITGIVPVGSGKSGSDKPGFVVTFNELIPIYTASQLNVKPSDFTITLNGIFSAGMTVDSVVPINLVDNQTTEFLVTLAGADGLGTITLGISPTADIKDLEGNQLDPTAAVSSTALDFNSQITTVNAVNFVGSVPSPTNQSSITYQIVFEASVSHADGSALGISDFEANAPNGGTVRGTVSEVTGSGTTYQVTVSFVSGTGELGIQPLSTIVNEYGVPVNLGAPEPYALANVDRTPPAVVSIVRTGGGSAITGSPTSTWTVTFSKPVNASSVNSSDFRLITSSSLEAEIVDVIGEGNLFQVTVRNITGDGTINLAVPQGASIFDNVGNRLVGDFTAGESYTTDRLAPRISYIDPGTESMVHAGDHIFWFVGFDQAVEPSTVTPEIFKLSNPDGTEANPTAFGRVASVIPSADSPYQYIVVVDQIGGNGQLRLDLPSGSPVEDSAGNRLANGFTSARVVVVDTHAPVPESISRSNNSPTAAAGVGFVITFDTPVTFKSLTPDDFEVVGTFSASGIVTSFSPIDAEGKRFGVQVSGITGEGTLGLAIRPTALITDLAGNPIAYGLGGQLPYSVDRVAPTVQEVLTIPNGSPILTGSSAIFEIAFTEIVTASTVNPSDFILLKTGGITGTVLSVQPKSGVGNDQRYLVTVNGVSGNGTLGLQVPSGAIITDLLGNNLSGGYTIGQTFSVRTTAPTVAAITTTLPTSQIVRVSTASFNLSFSKPVQLSTVNTGSLKIGTVGGISGTLTNASIIPLDGDLTTATNFQVVVTNIQGSGSLQLKVLANLIKDATGLVLITPYSGQLVSIDNQAPNIVGTPLLNVSPTSASGFGFRVNFSENVVVESVLPTSFALSDPTLSVTGQIWNIVPVSPINGRASAFNVLVQGIKGSGTVGLTLLPDSGIQDALGNTQNAAFNGSTLYSVQNALGTTNPLVSSIKLDPANPATASSATFLVAFDKAVTNVLTTSFTTTIPGVTVDLVTPINPSLYSVVVSQFPSIQGNLRLNLPSNSGIVDATSGSPCLGFLAGETLIRSSVVPVSSTVDTSLATNGGLTGRVIYHVTFSQPVQILTVENNLLLNFDFTAVSGNAVGSVLSATAADPSGGLATRFDIEVGTLSGQGKLRLNVASTNLILSAGSNGTAAYSAGQSYNIDTVNPTVVSIVCLNGALTSASQISWRVTFSEPVVAASVTQDSLFLVESGSARGGFASISGSGAVYQITANLVEGMGTIGLSVLPGSGLSGIKDLAGNVLVEAAQGPNTNVDYTPPRVLGVAIKDASSVSSGPASFAIGFSKAMNPTTVNNSALKLFADPLGSVTSSIQTIVATGTNTFDVGTSITDGEGRLGLDAIVGRARDAAGNPLVAGFSEGQTYVVTANPPILGFISTVDNLSTRQRSLDFYAYFSTPMNPQTVVASAFQTVSSLGSVTGSVTKVVPIDAQSTQFRITVENVSGNGSLTVEPINGNTMANQMGQVLVYNPNLYSQAYEVDHIAPTVTDIAIEGNSLTNASTVQFLVTFSEQISDASLIPAAFGLVTTGNLIGRVSLVEWGYLTYTVTVDNLYGEGSVALVVLGNGLITDQAGNSFVGNPVTGPAITISTQAPTVLSINPIGTTKTNASEVQFQVTFSQPMDLATVEPSDFVPQFSGSLSGQTLTAVAEPGSTSVFTITVGNLVGKGTVGLLVPENATLTDQAGNPLQSTFTGTSTFDVNRIAPVITSFQSLEGYNPTKRSAPFLLSFSEPVVGVTPASFTITPAGAGSITDLQTLDGGISWTFNVLSSRQGALKVTLIPAGITDTYGNALVKGGSVSINYAPALPTVAALGIGGLPKVQVITADGSIKIFQPFGSGYKGGITVAAGDVNGDGVADIIVGVASGAAPHIKVFSGTTYQPIMSFFAFATSFTGGVNVGAGDINGDGFSDVIVGSGLNARPHVKAFSGSNGIAIRSFFAYAANFAGGVRVATGDVDGDGIAEIITGSGAGTRGHIKAFKGGFNTVIRSFFAYGPSISTGVFVASGDLDGDGQAEIVASLAQGSLPTVRIFKGAMIAPHQEFQAFTTSFRGGSRVAIVNRADQTGPVIAAGNGPGLSSQIRSFNGQSTAFIDSVFVLTEFEFQGGIYVG